MAKSPRCLKIASTLRLRSSLTTMVSMLSIPLPTCVSPWRASGWAPLPLEVQQRFQDISGCRLAEGWGMTETSPTGTFTPLEGAVKPGSCGIPIPGITIKFADVDDPSRYVGLGEKGEI